MRLPADAWPLNPATLAALPPTGLVNARHTRYAGGTFTVPLTRFPAPDQATVQALYQVLHDLWATLTAARAEPTPPTPAVLDLLTRSGWGHLLHQVRQLGATLPADRSMEAVRPIIHEVRGGSLNALVGAIQLLELDGGAATDVLPLLVGARDHLATLRSLFPDLDPPGTQHDHAPQLQPVERLVEKWRDRPITIGDRVAAIHIDCPFQGAVATRPSEVVAMDGVLTNLVNNAVRFAADGVVHLVILPHAAGQDVRCVVANRLTPQHQQTLQERFGTDWRGLFAGGFTIGGTGLGLRIAAAYVADCYGLPALDAASEQRYIAAQPIGDYFVATFHWPVAGNGERVRT